MIALEEHPRRADAVRNRARVVSAAAELFAERGLEASVPEIAARAGVGKATVYRSFPTKEHLMAAVIVGRLADFEARVRRALEAEDAWTAFVDVIGEQLEIQAADRALVGGLSRTFRVPELDAARASVWAALDELMARARAGGAMRADATKEDLRVLWVGSTRLLAAEDVADPAVWRRCAALLAAALRADGTPAPRT